MTAKNSAKQSATTTATQQATADFLHQPKLLQIE